MRDDNLLLVGNFAPGTGYAWGMIEGCFAALGAHCRDQGGRAWACFPELGAAPPAYAAHGIAVEAFDFARAPAPALWRFLRARRIRTVYLVDWPASSLRYAVLRLAGVRRIVEHDHTAGTVERLPPLRRALRFLANRLRLVSADRVLAVSDYVRDVLQRVHAVPARKLLTVHNGIALDDAPPALDLHAEYAIPRERRIVFCAARANRYKGIEVLIDAAAELVQARGRRDLHFLYVGDGPDLAAFRARVAAHGLDSWFTLPGKVPSIAPLLPGVTLSVAPSLVREGFGMVVIEAMAAGKPVIASRSGGMAELLEDGVDGCYVEPGDVAGLAEAIARLGDDPQRCAEIGRRARNSVARRFTSAAQHARLRAAFAPA
ncbi:MAG TPA: glycosyltransferase family 4 protein [Gammaproteobacteria bacterium]